MAEDADVTVDWRRPGVGEGVEDICAGVGLAVLSISGVSTVSGDKAGIAKDGLSPSESSAAGCSESAASTGGGGGNRLGWIVSGGIGLIGAT